MSYVLAYPRKDFREELKKRRSSFIVAKTPGHEDRFEETSVITHRAFFDTDMLPKLRLNTYVKRTKE